MRTPTLTRSFATPAVAASLHARRSTSVLRLLVLAAGPLVTFAVLAGVAERAPFADTFAHYATLVAVLAWSPLPLSFPAVLLDDDRDRALADWARLPRAVALVPWMLVRSPARVEMAVSLVGWAALIALIATR